LSLLLTDVVREHVNDTPIAVTLSGGMDSSSVLASAVQSGADVMAVSWDAPDVPSASELYWARQTAARLGVQHEIVTVDPASLLPEAGIETPRWMPFYNMFNPIWESVGRAVASHGRRTLLTGFPGDIVFSSQVPPATDLLVSGRLMQLGRWLGERRRYYPSTYQLLKTELSAPLLRQAMPRRWARLREPCPWLHPDQHEVWRELQLDLVGKGLATSKAELLKGFTDGILVIIPEELDSILAPLGVRVLHPLLDARLLSFTAGLPAWFLHDGHRAKTVLREAMREFLPPEVLNLPRGAVLPGDMTRMAIRAREEPLMALTTNMRAAELGFIDERALAHRVMSFMRREHGSMDFWTALTLEDWLRRWW
jgi:asparagine synthase (glutamine-hydrolysing)